MTDNHTGIDTSAEAAKWVIERLEALKDADAALVVRALSAELTAAREALGEAAAVLRMMTDPDAIKSSTVANAFACCVSAEAKARKALGDQNSIKNIAAPTAHDDSGGV